MTNEDRITIALERISESLNAQVEIMVKRNALLIETNELQKASHEAYAKESEKRMALASPEFLEPLIKKALGELIAEAQK